MNAAGIIDEIRRLPREELQAIYEYLFSSEQELDSMLATFDKFPRKERLTEEEILALPRARLIRH
jgi:hypothetical protein